MYSISADIDVTSDFACQFRSVLPGMATTRGRGGGIAGRIGQRLGTTCFVVTFDLFCDEYARQCRFAERSYWSLGSWTVFQCVGVEKMAQKSFERIWTSLNGEKPKSLRRQGKMLANSTQFQYRQYRCVRVVLAYCKVSGCFEQCSAF